MAKYILIALILIISTINGCYDSSFGQPRQLEPPRYTKIASYTGAPLAIVPIIVDTTFSTMDKTAIDDAINAWNYVLNGYIILKVESWDFNMEVEVLKDVIYRHGLVIMKVASSNSIIPTQNNSESKTLAWANDIGGTKIWVVRDRFYQPDTFPIMLHELGHIFGADHEKEVPENKNFLMYPKYERGRWNCVDGRAMEKAANYHLLPPERLNYCY